MFAEVTYFADREFYLDWWNSTSYLDFMVKWNKPVTNFLMRYLYEKILKEYKFSEKTAIIIVITISAIAHEFCLILTFRALTTFTFVILIM